MEALPHLYLYLYQHLPGRGSSASPGTAGAPAMHNCRTRCAEVGIEAAPVQLRLFGTMVDSVLSHGAAAKKGLL